eukprot:15482410-Alexandrium_andersonii.AAC.1
MCEGWSPCGRERGGARAGGPTYRGGDPPRSSQIPAGSPPSTAGGQAVPCTCWGWSPNLEILPQPPAAGGAD